MFFCALFSRRSAIVLGASVSVCECRNMCVVRFLQSKTQICAKQNFPLHKLCKGIFMSEKTTERAHSLTYCNNVLSVFGVVSVLEISEREAQLKLSHSTLWIKGTGLNVVKLDREQGTVQLETQSVSQMVYRQSGLGLKGIFK